ncbi:hypothetical protein [Comamonas kerstersii]|uniref:Uncharacterized protein n=1 Tax=Comamonas kerstersii TaxID=225992 RepID=A0A6A1R1J8_9BURK|nr:hypothetical protein [Comamonas kerstersii]KAB0586170.1 hypothetical protein F7P80_11080 [Comamonas kerstersii]
MARTDIICMDTGEKLQHVTSVDVEAGIVWRAYQPIRISLRDLGEIDVYPTRFRSVYPIYAGDFWPHLVHCYGRQD